jgi:hypothetical protein
VRKSEKERERKITSFSFYNKRMSRCIQEQFEMSNCQENWKENEQSEKEYGREMWRERKQREREEK